MKKTERTYPRCLTLVNGIDYFLTPQPLNIAILINIIMKADVLAQL